MLVMPVAESEESIRKLIHAREVRQAKLLVKGLDAIGASP
jgi:hypothetical protein